MCQTQHKLLANPKAPWIAAAFMFLVCLPALSVGLVADDFYHRAILVGEGAEAGLEDPLMDLFRFVPPGAGADHLRDVGVVSWWADPDLKLGFLRPVTAATHLLDHLLWPNSPALQHAHSMIWFGAAVVLVGLTYRSVNGPTSVAGLAVLLFAIEDGHSMTIGWIANRNAAIALVFGLLALLAHIRWRRSTSPCWLFAALVAFTTALLAGEIAIGVLAYLAAWQLTMDHVRWSHRLGSLAPYAALMLGWRIAYDALGYGCTGSGLYIDPVLQPAAFAGALIERWPIMLGGIWLQVPVDLWAALARPGQLVLSGLGVAVCLFMAVLLTDLMRSKPEARFWAMGMTFALVPVAAAFPMSRLHLVAGIGAFGLVAMLVKDVGLLDVEARDPRPWTRRWAKILLVLHGPIALVLLVVGLLFLPVFNDLFTAGARLAPRDTALPHQSLIFVNGHDFPCSYTYIIRRIDGGPAPRRVAILGPMTSAANVTREDDRTLVIVSEDGWLDHPIDRLMHGTDPPFQVGQRFRTADFEASIRSVTPDGRPTAVAFVFDDPLENRNYRWVHWRHGGLERWPLPSIGENAHLVEQSLLALN